MSHKIVAALLLWLVSSAAVSEQFSAGALMGQWEFTAYAEASTPDDRVPVGLVFDFQPDGVLISKQSKGDTESSYSVDDDTIYYSGKGGDQTWIVRTFEAETSMVIDNSGTLMYLERR